jgi:FG-GAP-like repeat
MPRRLHRGFLMVPAVLAVLATAAESARAAPVAAPRFVRTIATGETGWFSSPSLVDLDGDRRLEIVAPTYATSVFDAGGRLLGKGTASRGRVYAPSLVADMDEDGVPEIVVGGNEGTVAAYNLVGGALRVKAGWPASTCSGGQCPETRGLAAADLDRDGRDEVVATTTNTSDTGSQVFVFEASGSPAAGWPRYNRADDATFNGAGNHGYGAYGENVGIGQLDDDPQLEVVVTYDNHLINLFNHDGTSVLASPWFTNRQSGFVGRPLGWGQFIRWLDPRVEDDHMHRHVGEWPHPSRNAWLQWTASPPSVADLDRDGRNEVIGVPNVERHVPYETVAYAVMVLDGAQGGGARSARRHRGFRRLPLTGRPADRGGDLYPPSGIPAPTIVDIRGDRRPEIVTAVPDGSIYAIGPSGRRLWRYDYARGARETFASEVVAADLNRDGRTELVFGVYGSEPGAGRLVVLSASGKRLRDIRLRNQRRDPNGVGIAAAPSIGDVDGDGRLEIVALTIDHGIDVYRVPRSGTGLMPWPTGRGSVLRSGT